MAAYLAILGMFLFIFAFVGIVLYVIFSFAFYKMAVNAGIENAWLAWIPVAQWYVLAQIIKSLRIAGYDVPYLEFVLPGATVIALILNRIPVIGSLVSIANFVLLLFALNKLYKMYKPDQAVLFTVLSIFGLPIPFIFLAIKDSKPVQ